MAKIFIIEDDKKIRNQLAIFLGRYGYECSYSDDFRNIIEIALNEDPDIILLDINLPYFDGYYICKEIRSISDIPIIVVTSRDTDLDEIMGINLGADDFVTKPYNSQILLARIKSVLNRYRGQNFIEKVEHNGVVLDISKGVVLHEGKETELTKNELRILNLLMKQKGSIVSRNEIMNELWQSDQFIDDNTLTVNIARLREKLKSIGIEDFIMTKRGQGYIVL
ncbi:response regulator transcription factor [Clostridiisalibacter paucivorans]|uniref:response regulator transcription factor n=1 Tax=Clostridiisalibacter paucivorans TaxID=408753 RepID=UPI000479B2B4|nr:response regulator transcription factor [Clostridiisalibacter paucivorans]